MRTTQTYSIDNPPEFKTRLLRWAQQHEEVLWLDSNEYPDRYSCFDAILAVEAFTAIQTDYEGAFGKLKEYQESTADWIFGYLSYDLKNDTEELTSENFDQLEFPDLFFFQLKKLFLLKGNTLEVQYLRMVDDEIADDLNEINATLIAEFPASSGGSARVVARIGKAEYLEKVRKMQEHIHRGDIYEANFCQEFYAEDLQLEPLETYQRLNSISHPPFAAFLRSGCHYLMSASPERYLQKTGQTLISQPIKGTARRSADPQEDKLIAEELARDEKERSENIMIVDLVRNDLSRTAAKGSVEVEELCGVHSFKQVHQLISTVKATLAEGIPAVEVLKTTFPMGSMTGAPKISAMKIIEELEESKRGLYSGALGYFTPEGDFDFSVVIRSVLYNQERQYASFSVGGAITAKSIPEKEYEECLLKARAMRESL